MSDTVRVCCKRGGTIQEIEAKKGETLLGIALENGIELEHACGGNGYCTTCLCEITANSENLSEITEQEIAMGVENRETRLGCQAKVTGDVSIEIPEY